MLNPSSSQKAEITLCVFPHLREFVAVDIRSYMPNSPSVKILSFRDIFNQEFQNTLESGFAKLVKRDNLRLMDIMGMPQELETLIRSESLKLVLKQLNENENENKVNSIGILLFAKDLLGIKREQLSVILEDLFGSDIDEAQLDELESELLRLIQAEQLEEARERQGDLTKLITGDGGPFLTLWQSSQKDNS